MTGSVASDLSFEWVQSHARYQPDALAVHDLSSGRRFTYQAFADRIDRLASLLRDEFGVAAGSHLACLCRNSADVFALQFAAWKVGAAFVPLNWRLVDAEIAEIFALLSPTLLALDDTQKRSLPGCPILALDRHGEQLDRLIAERDRLDGEPRNAGPDRVLSILFTSGTTGRPKGIPYTERMLANIVLHAGVHAGVTGNTRTLLCAPMFHSAGLFAATTPAFHYGGAVLITDGWDAAACLGFLTDVDLGISHFNGVPEHFNQIARLPAFGDATFASLELLGIGSAPISERLLERWADKGVPLTQSYGLTEAFGVSITPPGRAAEFLGSAGLPMMHTAMRLVSDGRDVARGEVGEIWVRGAGVMRGYWQDAEATAAAFEDGWLKTGDLARQDERGAYYIVDRLSDMIISGGENIYPAEIELALEKHPQVRSAAIVGVPDARWGETPAAIVTAATATLLNLESLVEHCRRELAGYKLPRYWFSVPQLPRTPQGKLRKEDLQRTVADLVAGKPNLQEMGLIELTDMELTA